MGDVQLALLAGLQQDAVFAATFRRSSYPVLVHAEGHGVTIVDALVVRKK